MVKIPDNPNFPAGYPEQLPSAEVARRWRELLGETAEAAVPLNLQVTEETVLPGEVVRQRVTYEVEEGETVPAYYLFRQGLAGDAAGVLAIHAHGGEEMMAAGKASCCAGEPDPWQYGYHAALAGFRVLTPDALCFGERRTAWGYVSFFMDEVNTHMELCSRGSSLAWKSVWDNSRALEALESLGSRSLGVMGVSGGSTQGYLLAAANPKVKAAACYFSFMTLRHQFYQYRLGHCLYHYLPGMMKAGIDWDQVAALIAPRKLFLAWGAQDEGTPEPMYRAFVAAVERRCAEEGLPPSVSVFEEAEVGHVVTAEALGAGLRFLREEL